MAAVLPTILGYVFIYLIVSCVYHRIDRKYISKWLLSVKNFSRDKDDPIHLDQAKGLVYGQKAKTKWWWALVASTVFSIWTFIIEGGPNPVVETVLWAIEVPVVFAGFYLEPAITRFFNKKRGLLEKIDQLESGEINVTKEVVKGAQDLRDLATETASGIGDSISETVGELKDRVSDIGDDISNKISEATERFSSEPEEIVPEKKEDPLDGLDAEKAIKQFTKGR